MVRHLPAVAIVAAMLLLGACSGGGDSSDTSAVAPPAATPPARTPTVIDDQLKALEKAKAVQATLDAAEAERRRKLEEAGG